MGQPISLFSGYSQRENRTTNYCLLVLRLLYEENPKYLAQVLGGLVGDELGDLVGVNFEQQRRRGESVPDGVMTQHSFAIYVETKNFDWFNDDQLERHLAALDREPAGLKVLLALSNFEVHHKARFDGIQQLCADRYEGRISFAAATFEDFLEALRIDHLPKNLADTVGELGTYFDEEDLLPTWRTWLDVVNCAGLPDDVLVGGVYMCPATGGAYSHSRCRYFGMYRNKSVEKVAEIEAVVDLQDAQEEKLRWRNTEGEMADWVSRARKVHGLRRPGDYPTRVFLLGPLFDTTFTKDSPGGMMGSKQYFDVGELDASGAEDLAAKLMGKVWSEI